MFASLWNSRTINVNMYVHVHKLRLNGYTLFVYM